MKRLEKCLFISFCLLMLTLCSWTALQAQTEKESTIEIKTILERLEALEKQVAQDPRPEDPRTLRVFWNRGLNFETEDGRFSSRLSGKIHMDTAIMNSQESLDDFVESHGDDFQDSVKFRRARITLSGAFHERLIYTAAYDFSGGDAEFKDVYLGFKGLPGNSVLKVGHYREPITMEAMTSADGLMLLERSSIQALAPSRNTGAGLFGTLLEDRLTWMAGVFYNTDGAGQGGGDWDISPALRLTGLPWYENEDRLLHLGASYSRREEDDYRAGTAPENSLAPDLIDTDGFPSSSLNTHLIPMNYGNLYGGETALALGSFSAQAEYIRLDIAPPRGPEPTFTGHYVQAGYFLTGEHRAFNNKKGAFGRVTPASDFLAETDGIGAWEVCARYSYLDLDDDGVLFGSELTDYTVGVNWFLTSSLRLSANFIHAHLEKIGSSDMLVMRLALDF